MADHDIMTEVRIKRIYDPPARSDGKRILVDRLWPRGIKRDDADLDAWLKDFAPSDTLRRWYHHDPQKWSEFKRRYIAELQKNPAAGELKKAMAASKPVTLLFAAKDDVHNNAAVLRDFLRGEDAADR
jgi:uncharacterized protein YeaO (DUF488 family)